MKWLKTNIKKVSLGQYPMGFFYKGEQFFTSFFGGCVSILFYLLVLAFAIVILVNIFAKTDYVLTESLSEMNFAQLKREHKTLASVLRAMNPYIGTVPTKSMNCYDSEAKIYVYQGDSDPIKQSLICEEHLDNQTNLTQLIFYIFDYEDFSIYDLKDLDFQIVCYNCGEYILFEKSRMYVTNNKVEKLINTFYLANNSMYLQTLQVLQVNSSESIFAGIRILKFLWNSMIFINSETLVYFQNLGKNETAIYFMFDKIQRNIENMPYQLFSAISEIGGFASIVGIGTVVMGIIHQKLAERSLRKRSFKEDQKDDKDKSCMRINYEKVFLTDKQKQRKQEVAKLYSYENLKRMMERLDALDGGNIVEKEEEEEEEFKDAQGFTTKIQNEEESFLSV